MVADLRAGTTYRLVGIVGQRASKKGALDGYRVWLRDRADVQAAPGGRAGRVAVAVSRRFHPTRARHRGRPAARRRTGDGRGRGHRRRRPPRRRRQADRDPGRQRRDRGLPAGERSARRRPGRAIRVEGTVGRALGAPRLRAATVTDLGTGAAGPAAVPERRTVRGGRVAARPDRREDHGRDAARRPLASGRSRRQRQRARDRARRAPGIASTSLVEGRAITVVGIVRRPYPTATDRRWTVIPRGPWDVAVGPAEGRRRVGRPGRARRADGDAASRVPRPGAATADGGRAHDRPRHARRTRRRGRPGRRARRGQDRHAGSPSTTARRSASSSSAASVAAFLDLIEAGDGLGIVGRVDAADERRPGPRRDGPRRPGSAGLARGERSARRPASRPSPTREPAPSARSARPASRTRCRARMGAGSASLGSCSRPLASLFVTASPATPGAAAPRRAWSRHGSPASRRPSEAA